jgi:hypothetical protein
LAKQEGSGQSVIFGLVPKLIGGEYLCRQGMGSPRFATSRQNLRESRTLMLGLAA